MNLRHCRPASALTRPRVNDVAAISNALRGLHISAPRCQNSSQPPSGGSRSSNASAPVISPRARSVAAGAQIQNLAQRKVLTAGGKGLAGSVSASGQNERRIISPIRRAPTVGGKLVTPRVQTRAPVGREGGGARFGPGAGARRPGGAAAGPRRNAGAPNQRRRQNKRQQRGKEQQEGEQGESRLSDAMLQYLLELKAKRRAIKPYTPHQATREELLSQAALSATLGQPGGAAQLLEQRLRQLASRRELEPVSLLSQARRLVHGQFVKFADDKEREAVLELVQQHQAEIAEKLSEKKGEEIAPKPIEFAELAGPARQTTTDMMVAGKYAVHQGENTKDVAARKIDLNGSYFGADKEKFLGRLNAVLSVQGAAKPQGAKAKA